MEELQKLFPNPKPALNYSNNWELLVAVVLSAQTTDKQVNKVTESLFEKYKSLEDYANADLDVFRNDISSIGFYKNKAKYVIEAANMLLSEHEGQIPKTIDDLIKLPGVGRKTANVVLAAAFGITEGIAVDTHVIRLSNQFGLTNHRDPKKIEQDLINIIPKSEWKHFTLRMIEYGREYSPAKNKTGDDPITKKLTTNN